jgi:hypothetical protein
VGAEELSAWSAEERSAPVLDKLRFLPGKRIEDVGCGVCGDYALQHRDRLPQPTRARGEPSVAREENGRTGVKKRRGAYWETSTFGVRCVRVGEC